MCVLLVSYRETAVTSDVNIKAKATKGLPDAKYCVH